MLDSEGQTGFCYVLACVELGARVELSPPYYERRKLFVEASVANLGVAHWMAKPTTSFTAS